jgi:hypothetical protein
MSLSSIIALANELKKKYNEHCLHRSTCRNKFICGHSYRNGELVSWTSCDHGATKFIANDNFVNCFCKDHYIDESYAEIYWPKNARSVTKQEAQQILDVQSIMSS